ncbi:MAG: OmpP1/FadL family transporter [Gemmobacter sp.]
MKHLVMATGVLALTAGAASAGGIDRSGQGVGNLFEAGRQLELSFGRVSPSVSGNDVAAFGGGPSGDVAPGYNQLGLSYKADINKQLSYALIIDQPFGANVIYGAGSVALGGTRAVAEATALTVLMRYKLDNGFSVHGGVRAQRAKAAIDLRGAAYGPLGAYSVRMANDTAAGYVVGVAYEKPEIALRVALTYNSAIEHNFDTVETGLPGPLAALNGVPSRTKVKTPQTVNLDFQTGVAPGTLVFGQIRWADWSSFKLEPVGFDTATGFTGGLIDLDDTFTYTLGVGRRFNENWAGSFSMQYEKKGDPLVSPLAPTNGRIGATLAAVYTKDNMKITTGINYTKVGNAQPETGTPDVARANFTGNKSVGIGVRVAFTF